jgi:hypothetical protein
MSSSVSSISVTETKLSRQQIREEYVDVAYRQTFARNN